MKIIRYGSYEDIDVEFLDEFHDALYAYKFDIRNDRNYVA